MTLIKPLTKEEKLAVAKRARTLIKKPGFWIQNKYFSRVEGVIVGACLEGACNLAAIEILGLDRAKELGAVRVYSLSPRSSSDFTRKLSVSNVAVKYAKQRWNSLFATANGVNDFQKTKKADILRILDRYIKELS